MMNLFEMKKLIKRLTSPTPFFFKKVRNLGLYLTGLSGVLIALPVQSETVSKLIPVIATAGFTTSFVAQLSKSKNNDKQRKRRTEKPV